MKGKAAQRPFWVCLRALVLAFLRELRSRESGWAAFVNSSETTRLSYLLLAQVSKVFRYRQSYLYMENNIGLVFLVCGT